MYVSVCVVFALIRTMGYNYSADELQEMLNELSGLFEQIKNFSYFYHFMATFYN